MKEYITYRNVIKLGLAVLTASTLISCAQSKKTFPIAEVNGSISALSTPSQPQQNSVDNKYPSTTPQQYYSRTLKSRIIPNLLKNSGKNDTIRPPETICRKALFTSIIIVNNQKDTYESCIDSHFTTYKNQTFRLLYRTYHKVRNERGKKVDALRTGVLVDFGDITKNVRFATLLTVMTLSESPGVGNNVYGPFFKSFKNKNSIKNSTITKCDISHPAIDIPITWKPGETSNASGLYQFITTTQASQLQAFNAKNAYNFKLINPCGPKFKSLFTSTGKITNDVQFIKTFQYLVQHKEKRYQSLLRAREFVKHISYNPHIQPIYPIITILNNYSSQLKKILFNPNLSDQQAVLQMLEIMSNTWTSFPGGSEPNGMTKQFPSYIRANIPYYKAFFKANKPLLNQSKKSVANPNNPTTIRTTQPVNNIVPLSNRGNSKKNESSNNTKIGPSSITQKGTICYPNNPKDPRLLNPHQARYYDQRSISLNCTPLKKTKEELKQL